MIRGCRSSPQAARSAAREIIDVDGMKPEDYVNVKAFDQMTPINPEQWLRLETGSSRSPRA